MSEEKKHVFEGKAGRIEERGPQIVLKLCDSFLIVPLIPYRSRLEIWVASRSYFSKKIHEVKFHLGKSVLIS